MTSAMPAQAGLWKLLTGETYKEYAHRTNQERIEKNLTWQWTKDDWKAAGIGVAIVAPLVAGAGAAGAAIGTCGVGSPTVDAAGNIIGTVTGPGVVQFAV